uniref:NADH-ubiquinone oxidoreductase chain 4 n=1 Tax=Spathoderma clenchi TaxID=1638910 RepID=A0A343YND0_9MOLL|nr:NADH dehydrogenase subunit 4 [Spathoderma clenchi]
MLLAGVLLSPSWAYTMALSLAAATLTTMTLFSPGGAPTMATITGSIDQISSTLMALTLWVTALMLLASWRVWANKDRPNIFTGLITTLAAILLMTFYLKHFLLFYVLFEVSLVPTLMVILGWGYQPERLQASMYFLMYTLIASLPLLLNIIALFNNSAHFSMILPFEVISPNFLWSLCMLTAFLVKLPIFFLHLWLPKAHVQAPLAGSMILAAVLLKLGGYGLLRIIFMFSPALKGGALIMLYCLVGGGLTSLLCLRQSDLKSLIALSSVAHMSLVIAGAFSESKWGSAGALGIMIAHGLTSSCMFLLANITYEKVNSRSLYLSKGMMMLYPATTMWWFLIVAMNMAAPPSVNLLSEVLIMRAGLSYSCAALLALAVMSMVTAGYSLYMFSAIQHGQMSPHLNTKPAENYLNYLSLMMHWAPGNALFLAPLIPMGA